MWIGIALGASWFAVALGTLCTALAGAVGWRFVRDVAGSARWWWVFMAGVGASAVGVGVWVGMPAAPALVWFTAAALVLAAVDSLLLRLPNALVYPTLVVVALWLPTAAIVNNELGVALRVLGSGAVVGLGYFVLHLLSPNGFGMGDVKFAPAIAMVMGWHSWGWVLFASIAAFALAAIWGLGLMMHRRRGHLLPFGPFMVAGAAVTPMVGDELLRWWF